MSDAVPIGRTTGRFWRWAVRLAVAMFILIALLAALVAALDTSPGRRFLIDQIEGQQRDDGLTIRIGRIDGSIFTTPVLRDVRLGDPDGNFLELAEARLDWQPWQFALRRRLIIDSLIIPRAELSRLPRLRDTGRDDPLLPDFDIVIGSVRIDQLAIDPAVAGQPHLATISGNGTVTGGEARVMLDARLRDGGDRLRLALIAEPDRDLFDMDADVVAPAGGVLAAILGTDSSITAVIRGDGNWSSWRGVMLARSGDVSLASIRLTVRDGQLTALGRVAQETQLSGLARDLTTGGLSVDVTGRIAERRWNGQAALISRAVQLTANGGIDAGRGRFAALRLDARVRDGSTLAEGLDTQSAQLALLVDGAWSAPRIDYRLTAARITQGAIRLADVEAAGTVAAMRSGMAIPVALRIGAVSGLAPPIDRALANFRAEGIISWLDGGIGSDALRLSATGLTGRLSLRYGTNDGAVSFAINGAMPDLDLPGVGRMDLIADLTGGRPAGGGGFAARGTARAQLRRFDNEFLRGIAGGEPDVRAVISFGADAILRFSDLRVTAPQLTLTGAGQFSSDGRIIVDGRGVHGQYGPLRVAVAGPLARPRVEAWLTAPLSAMQLSNVHIVAEPDAQGFALRVDGGSLLGPFDAVGAIILPAGQSALLDVTRLTASGTSARGRLAIAPGGLVGQLVLAGGGIDGTALFSLPGAVQRIALSLTARNARFAGPPPISIARGQVQATLLLDPGGADINATFEAVGLSRGTVTLARVAGNAQLINGVGTVQASLAGARGRNVMAQTVINVSPDRLVVRANGSLAGQPLRLTRSAVLRRIAGGWELAPAELTYAGGRAQVSGAMTASATRISAALDNLPVGLLQLAWPDLGIGGRASGRLTYVDDGTLPTGTAQMRVIGLTRSGLVDASAPIDVALNAGLTGTNAAVRAVLQRNGQTIGRAQLRLSPLASGGDLMTRLTSAPLFGQVRYDGEAGTLWRLTGVESLSISGHVAIAADMAGTLDNPLLRGVLRTRDARLESFQTGTVVTGISTVGQFNGSQLRLRDIRGVTPGGGSITGAGEIDLALSSDLTMDIRLEADGALLVDRDDLVARVTGPVRLSSDGNGGLVSARLRMDSGRFRLGQATAAEALPVIRVVETNVPADRPAPRRSYRPWRLDLAVTGRNGFNVTGLGLDSMWSTDLTVRGDVSNFAILGTARLVRGDYIFAGRRFELESGVIRFTGQTPVDPALDIVAVDDVSGIDATIRVRGTGLRPEITFESVPALPEDELLSRILFGASITDISVTEAAQLGIALAGLRGGDGLDPINAIRRATGLDRLRILPADTALGTGTAVAAGKFITRRVYVEVITDGQGYGATRIEYQITRWLALLASISTLGRESASVRVQRNY